MASSSEEDPAKLVLDKTSSELQQTGKKLDATIQATDENLASLRKTIAALDAFEARWKDVQRKFGEMLGASLSAAMGLETPCTLTEEEKRSVFGGESPNLPELCKRLKGGQYQRVIVMTGAGISVSAGIPDFRSPKSGLYESLDLERFQLPSAQAAHDIDFFRKNPKPFFMLAKEIFSKQDYKPTSAHYFIKLLSDKGYLLRCYSQNIDGLEEKAGVPKEALVTAHGTFEDATCTNSTCGKTFPSSKVKSAVLSDAIPLCDSCKSVVKPNIVFFGEDLPKRFKELTEKDFVECNLLIVMGTSLKVQPFCGLVNRVKQTTPRLLINKERVGSFSLQCEGGYRDIAELDECDAAVSRICEMCGWTQDLDKLLLAKGAKSMAEKSSRPHPPPANSTPKNVPVRRHHHTHKK